MHLLSQTLLCCRVKGCTGGEKSLCANVTETAETPREYTETLGKRMLDMVDYALVLALAQKLGVAVPATKEAVTEESLRVVFRLIAEVEITQGELICTACNRKYPIIDGIPNLILDDKEI